MDLRRQFPLVFSRKNTLALCSGKKLHVLLLMFCCWVPWGEQSALEYVSTRNIALSVSLSKPRKAYASSFHWVSDTGKGVQEATFSSGSCADAVEASMASAAMAEVKCIFESFLTGGRCFGIRIFDNW